MLGHKAGEDNARAERQRTISLSQAPRLCNAIELAFLNDSLVRFIGILYPVLTVIAFGWQELRNLINAVRAPATEGSGHKAHRLTDFEFMSAHEGTPSCPTALRTTLSVEPSNFNCLLQQNTIPRNCPVGAISTCSILWSNDAPHLGGASEPGTG